LFELVISQIFLRPSTTAPSRLDADSSAGRGGPPIRIRGGSRFGCWHFRRV